MASGPRIIRRIATDVGGTFTDLVYFEIDQATGRQTVRTAKTDTTPPDFEVGVLAALAKAGITVGEVDLFVHGTTVVINALTERKGARTALITTEGFRDVLEIARGNRPDFFNLLYRKPLPFVPRRLRAELPGRMSYRGEEREPLDLSRLPAILDGFRGEGVEAVAVCLLHAYANPAHEERVAAAIAAAWPEASVVASHQITREWREYERTSTTVLSAFVQPTAGRYLDRLAAGLEARGLAAEPYIMQSNCGVDTLSATRAIPITMVESGPASGIWGAAELGRLIGSPDVIALDIGGTTAKCSLIEGGQVRIKTDYWIERDARSAGYPIMVPVVDLAEIGNGGGSIAWVDDFGKLRVGPQSAGAVPGPAAYGKGGGEATTTDANLALGRINPSFFCGGEIEADMDAVWRALARVGRRLGLAPVEAARGILRIANANMVNALKLVSLNRGYDPRDFVLAAFGGGGGMHAVELAAELGCRAVVVPRAAAVFSAWGMMMSDLRRDSFLTRLIDASRDDAAATLDRLAQEAMAAARGRFAGEGLGAEDVALRIFVKCRYQNQEHAVEVEIAAGRVDAGAFAGLLRDFHAAYEREYTYRLDAPVEIVGLHLVAAVAIGKLAPAPLPRSGGRVEEAVKGFREVDFAEGGVHRATIYDAGRLAPGMRFVGPAVVEDPGTTIVVHPGNAVAIDDYGNTSIALEAPSR